MWTASYWNGRYWTASYWNKVGGTPPPPVVTGIFRGLLSIQPAIGMDGLGATPALSARTETQPALSGTVEII